MRRLRGLAAALGCAAALLTGCTGGDGTAETDREPPRARPPAGKPSAHPAPGDFNGDGYEDYAAPLATRADGGAKGGGAKGGGRVTNTLVIVYGSRTGPRPQWTVRVPLGATDHRAPLRADLDGDGFTDLIGNRGDARDPGAYLMRGGPRGLSAPRRLHLPPGFRPLAAGDFDGDGSTDLLDGGRGGSGDPNAEPGTTALGTVAYGPYDRAYGGLPRSSKGLDLGQHGYASPRQAVTGDFDADGRTDAVFLYGYDAEEDESAPPDLTPVAYYRGTPGGLERAQAPEHRLRQALATADGPRGATAADVDGDGVTDVVASGEVGITGGKVTVVHGARAGLGAGRPDQVVQGRGTTWGLGPLAGDVTGDGRVDLVVGRPGFRLVDPDRVLLLAGGRRGLAAAPTRTVSGADAGLPGAAKPFDFTAADLLDADGDGHDDVLVFSERWNGSQGAFIVLRGGADGIDARRTWHVTPRDLGVRLAPRQP
ncbi:FG-GAP repeat domain-containing protein [Streptomyces sp. G45]|uniref:FG-GAP repeat domain-containing protein n=1 Tax=Streptomyces sp. G45 TaxID=3406627 RepID=UPI003C1EFB2E